MKKHSYMVTDAVDINFENSVRNAPSALWWPVWGRFKAFLAWYRDAPMLYIPLSDDAIGNLGAKMRLILEKYKNRFSWSSASDVQDLDEEVRIKHRRRSQCRSDRVWSVRVFQNCLSGVWALGNWGRTAVRGYTRPQVFRLARLRPMRWLNYLWILKIKHRGKKSRGPLWDVRDEETAFNSWGSKAKRWINWPGLSVLSKMGCWEITLATLKKAWTRLPRHYVRQVRRRHQGDSEEQLVLCRHLKKDVGESQTIQIAKKSGIPLRSNLL